MGIDLIPHALQNTKFEIEILKFQPIVGPEKFCEENFVKFCEENPFTANLPN